MGENMIGLIYKDIYNLRKYVKQISISLVILGLVAVNLKNPAYLIGVIAIMCSMMVITSMSYDEYAKWDKYALTMPIMRKDVVLSKYILLILADIIGTGIAGILAVIMSLVMNLEGIRDISLISGSIALASLFMFSVMIPILYKYGVEKARIIMFAVFGITALAGTAFVKLMQWLNIPKPGTEQIKLMGYAFPVIVIVTVFISYNISVMVFNKKEL